MGERERIFPLAENRESVDPEFIRVADLSPLSPELSTYCRFVNSQHNILTPSRDSRILIGLRDDWAAELASNGSLFV